MRRTTPENMLVALISLTLCLINSTPSGAQVNSHQKISDTEGGFSGGLDDGDAFGVKVASLGDLNGDGVTDLAVGAHLDDDGGTDRGALWILFLNADGTVKMHQKVSALQGNFTGDLDDGDAFGVGVENLGDFDGDGVADLAVGARDDDDGGTDRGAFWILFLNTDGTVKSYQKISSTQGGFTGDLDDGDGFGQSLANLGDLNGDGVTDLAVGAYLDDDGGSDRGAVWVLFLNADGTVKSHQKISSTQGGLTGDLDDGDVFANTIASLGDLDGDGINDLAVGADQGDDGGMDRGEVWILFLNADGTVKAHQKISSTQGGFTGDLDDGDRFGFVSSLEGLDGDHAASLAVGAVLDDDGGADRGALWLLFLNADGTVGSYQKISSTQGGFVGPLDENDQLGSQATSLGDLDGDGGVDLAAAARLDDDGGTDRGAVWILFTDFLVSTGVERAGADIPSDYRLAQNYPNPFNPNTTMQFDLPRAGHVTLKVYDVLGREVAALVDEVLGAGMYNATWNAADAPSGLYLYRLQAGAFSQTGKMILMK